MNVDDPISAKFQTLVESLMAQTTSEIVKIFVEVLLEMRPEVSHSWREANDLKLEDSDEPITEIVLRSEAAVNFKRETEEVFLSDVVDLVQTPKDAVNDNTGIMQGNVSVHERDTSWATPPAEAIQCQPVALVKDSSGTNQSVNNPNQTQDALVLQPLVKHKGGRPPKTCRATEHQQSTTDMVSKSPIQELHDEETAVDEKGIPGFHHVERLAEYLVELRNPTTMALTSEQANTILDMWQNLDTWDKQRILYIAQLQDRLLNGHFQAISMPGLESRTNCDLGTSASSTEWPDCCRLVEAIFVRLCNIHCSHQEKNEGTMKQWTLILQDYRTIRRLLLGNCAVMQGTSLQLVEVNPNALIQWHSHRIKDQGLTRSFLDGLPPSLPEAEGPFLQGRDVPVKHTQHPALVHDNKPQDRTAGQVKQKRSSVGELPSIRPKLPTQRELFGSVQEPPKYLQVIPNISVRTAPMLQTVHVLQPMPTIVCGPPQNNVLHSDIQDHSKPRQKRSYNRVVQGNTCKKCGQFRSAVTGHSQYKGIVYCPQTETLDKKLWLEKMRKKCK
ncbi:uncharacterized protein [Hoplias malabaricus]|uniref:uncharacterized protein isoform X2 n=1 Tax=Hoplias malabaricus TaxID=27720 RepID=UPI003462ECCB